jgi:hypothetical protein
MLPAGQFWEGSIFEVPHTGLMSCDIVKFREDGGRNIGRHAH